MTAEQMNPDDNRRPAMSLGDEMLRLQEACHFVRVPEGTLRYWRHLGAGPRSFKVGRHVRIKESVLADFIESNTVRAVTRPRRLRVVA